MKPKIKFIPLIIVLILLLLSLTAYNMLTLTNKPIYTEELNIKFTIGDKIGLIINQASLDFGTIIQDTSSQKTINLTNQYNFPLKVKMVMTPELENYLFSENNFIIQPKDTLEHTFLLIIPKDAKEGNYSGVIKLHFFKLD